VAPQPGAVRTVTEGVGLVTSRDGSVTRIRPGDTVTIGAGEEHWHGGKATTCMSHLALVTSSGETDPTTWLEAVTEEEYAAAQDA
jgi:quercetin dioxygenase-like cupin family protein